MVRRLDLEIGGGEAEGAPRASLALVGVSHQSASVGELERAVLDPEGVRRAVTALAADRRIAEAAVVATCNRTEAYLTAADRDVAVALARDLFRRIGAINQGSIYVKFGRDAAAHLCRLAAGIDSLMVGEVQILGQVKQAYALAIEERAAGPILGRLFATAFRAGKRARTETRIGEGTVSLSSAALGLAQKIFSDLKGSTLLVVGAGETATLAARHFVEAGIGALVVANRTRERAARLAGELGGRAIGLEGLAGGVEEADIVFTATASPVPVITHEMAAAAQARRGRRPLVFIDIAMPRDVDPRVNDLEGVFVHDMGALESIVNRNRERRRREIPRIETIVAEEVEHHEQWLAALEAGATIRDLKAWSEAVRRAVLAEWTGRAAPAELDRLDQAVRAALNKLLHQPMARLRRPRERAGDPARLLAAARELFGLEERPDADAERGGRGRRGRGDPHPPEPGE